MGFKINDISRIRKKKYEFYNKVATRLGLKTLTIEQLQERRLNLNLKNYKSEAYFNYLLRSYSFKKKINVFRNYCVLNLFFIDFYVPELNLAIELDGKIHDQKKDYDSWRDSFLNKIDIIVVRIKAFDEDKSRKVIERILLRLNVENHKITKRKRSLKSKEEINFYRNKRLKNRYNYATKSAEKIKEMREKQILWSLGKAPSPIKSNIDK